MRTLILCGLVVFPIAAQEDSWKKEIDNALVRVERLIVAPREAVAAAEMPPALLVFLTDYSVRLTTAARTEEPRGKPGQFRWHPGGRIGLENLSEHRVEVARVTPKFSPASEEPSAILNSRNILFDNDLIRVRHIRFARGGKNPNAPRNSRAALAPATGPQGCSTGHRNPDTNTCVNPSDSHWVEGVGFPNRATVGRNTLLTGGTANFDLESVYIARDRRAKAAGVSLGSSECLQPSAVRSSAGEKRARHPRTPGRPGVSFFESGFHQ